MQSTDLNSIINSIVQTLITFLMDFFRQGLAAFLF